MAKKSYAVIGLGQFGTAVCEQLIENGADVIAIDIYEDRVKHISKKISTAFIADATQEDVLKNLGVGDVDTAIVAFGQDEKASILTTVILRELGVRHIIVRVDNEYYAPIMKKLGASEIVSPQKSAGESLANRLGSLDYKDFHKLDRKYSVVSIMVNQSFLPISLMDLKPKEKYGVNILLVIRQDGKSFVPGGSDRILPGDTVFVVGTNKTVNDFRVGINEKRSKKSV